MLSNLRNKIEKINNAIASAMLKAHFTPTSVTVLGFCLAIISAAFYAYPIIHWHQIAAALLLFGSGFCDILDGAMARLEKQNSEFGNFLDSTLDRYSDVLIISGIMIFYRSTATLGISMFAWGFIALSGSILVSYTRARAEVLDVQLESVGLAERSERIIIIILFSFTSYLNWAIIILAFLTTITVIQRVIITCSKLHKRKKV